MAFDVADLENLDEDLDRLDKNAEAPELAPTSVGEVSDVSVGSSCLAAEYFEVAARRNLSWYHPAKKAWLRTGQTSDEWRGWSTERAGDTVVPPSWCPWEQMLDDSDPPFYRWFVDGLTNAAFSEVDLHVLEGRGRQLAYIEEPDPLHAGAAQAEITRGQLLARSAAASRVLAKDFSLTTGDRVLFYLPAGIEQIVWVEACKRLGIIYCCCNPSLPPEQIADRVVVLAAKVVITVDHPDWGHNVHSALNSFLPVSKAVALAVDRLGETKESLLSRWSSRSAVSVFEPPFSDATDVTFVNGHALLDAKVLVLGSVEIAMSPAHRKMVAPPCKAVTRVLQELDVPRQDLDGPHDVADVWQHFGPPVPLEANFPLFIIFTSGTTGKPKGVVHAHGYVAGLVETMKASFNADPAADKMLTVGALGWITGQSYQISAVLASGVTCVLMRGNPVQPSRARFGDVIRKHGITIFKAGSAFLRDVMATPEGMQQVRDTATESLKVATFCAEPVSEAVQDFAQNAICPEYINSYWATEHGGIAFSRCFGDQRQPLKADAHCWPLPWVEGDVYVFDDATRPSSRDGLWTARSAREGERADIAVTRPYPYMFRYVWGCLESFGQPSWRGDRQLMVETYWRRTQVPGKRPDWVYIQGDFAVKHPGGAFTFHGRSDEALNVNGILFGTEHIEGAILRDKALDPNSPVGNCVVVGYPDHIAGEVPMAFVTPGDPQAPLTSMDFMRLFRLVQEIVGPVSVKFVAVSALPQTFSGKFLRRLLSSIVREQPLGDQSTVCNPECIPRIQEEFERWKESQRPW